MAAEEIAETVYNVSPNLGGKIMKFEFVGATTGDWVIFDDPIGAVEATLITGGTAATLYATGAIHTGGMTATGTSALYDGTTAEQMPTSGYLMVDNGEIIKYSGVTKANTSGTVTFDARGCFGTTAAIGSDGDVFYILNTVVFTLGTVGPVRGIADVIGE